MKRLLFSLCLLLASINIGYAQSANRRLAPQTGTFPAQQTFYVKNNNGKGGVLSLHLYYADGAKMIRCSVGGMFGLFRYVDETSDRILFREGTFQPAWGQFNAMVWKDNIHGRTIVIFKNWSKIRYQTAGNYTEYNQFTTKADFDNYQQAIRNLNARMNSGGYGGGSSNSQQNYNESRSSHTDKACSFCRGSGTCSSCRGTGGSWQDTGYYIGTGNQSWINCGSCNGRGRCFNCHGTGKQATY